MFNLIERSKLYSLVIVCMLVFACGAPANAFFFNKAKPGEPTKEELAVAAKVPYKIESLHHSLIDEESATATVIVPLGLSKEQITAICKSAIVDIEKRCKREMKEVTLDVFHENTVDMSEGSFSCARYILDRRGKRSEPETFAFYDYYFIEPEKYEIKGLTQEKAVQLWHDIIRAERKFGVGTQELQETKTKLYKAYGVGPNDANKLSTWAVVDMFGNPEENSSTPKKETTPTPEKKIHGISASPDALKDKINAFFSSMYRSDLITSIELTAGDENRVNDVYNVKLGHGISETILQMVTPKDKDTVISIMAISVPKSEEESTNFMLVAGCIIGTLSPELSKEDRAALISELMSNPNGGLNKEKAVVRGEISYWFGASELTGVLFSAENKNDNLQ